MHITERQKKIFSLITGQSRHQIIIELYKIRIQNKNSEQINEDDLQKKYRLESQQ